MRTEVAAAKARLKAWALATPAKVAIDGIVQQVRENDGCAATQTRESARLGAAEQVVDGWRKSRSVMG